MMLFFTSKEFFFILLGARPYHLRPEQPHPAFLPSYAKEGLNIYPPLSTLKMEAAHSFLPQESPDDGLSGPKHVASRIIKIFVCVTVSPPVLLL
jgi:hypothetical protein